MKMTAAPSHLSTLAGPGSRGLEDLSVDLARSPVDRQCAFDLRKDIYRRKGLLPSNTPCPQVVPQACAPGSAIFVVRQQDAIVGTITCYMDSVIGLPIDEVHAEEAGDMRRRFTRISEVGGLAVLEARRGVGITMMLYQSAFRWAVANNAQCLVACVNPSSRRVYTKLLLFDVLGACKQHPRFLGAPSIPIALDLTTASARYKNAHGVDLNTFVETWLPQSFGELADPGYVQWPAYPRSTQIAG